MSENVMSGSGILEQLDQAELQRAHWRWTTLASLADYLDAGVAVAIGASLPLWTKHYHLGTSTVSLLALLGANALSTALSAMVVGRLGDRFGRKVIYTTDLLVYAVGVLLLAFSVDAAMIMIGAVVTGLAIGADVPTSWSLIAEYAPRRARGRLMGMTNIFWYVGPIVSLLLMLLLSPLGLLASRIVFLELVAVALVTWFLRRGMVESPRWLLEQGRPVPASELAELGVHATGVATAGADGPAGPPRVRLGVRDLFRGPIVRSLFVIVPLYIMWSIPAGTYGFFLPHILTSIGGSGQAASDGISALLYGSAILSVLFVYMPLSDRVDRRVLYAVSAAMCAAGFFLLQFASIKDPAVAVANVLLFGIGQGIGLWPLQRVWSVELFPTELRNTGQGAVWSTMRVAESIFKYNVAALLVAIGLSGLGLLFGALFVVCMLVGGLFGPKTQGRSLEGVTAA